MFDRNDDDVARFSAFRAALEGKFGLRDGETVDRLAYELAKNHPSIGPADLTQPVVDAFLDEELSRLAELSNRIDTSQLSEKDRRAHAATDATLNELIRNKN